MTMPNAAIPIRAAVEKLDAEYDRNDQLVFLYHLPNTAPRVVVLPRSTTAKREREIERVVQTVAVADRTAAIHHWIGAYIYQGDAVNLKMAAQLCRYLIARQAQPVLAKRMRLFFAALTSCKYLTLGGADTQEEFEQQIQEFMEEPTEAIIQAASAKRRMMH